MPVFEVDFPQTNLISIEPYNPHLHVLQDPADSAKLERLSRYLFVLTNRSGKSISAISVRYTIAQRDRSGTGATGMDRFSEGGEPYLKPGAQVLIGPGVLSLFTGGNVHGRGRDPATIEAADKVTLSLDIVVFEDGQVIGSDEGRMIDTVENRKIAIAEVIRQVRAAESQNGDVQALLQRLSIRPTHPLPSPAPGFVSGGRSDMSSVEMQVSQIAGQLLLRIDDLDLVIVRLQRPIPAFHR